jgi:hypothetical protein
VRQLGIAAAHAKAAAAKRGASGCQGFWSCAAHVGKAFVRKVKHGIDSASAFIDRNQKWINLAATIGCLVVSAVICVAGEALIEGLEFGAHRWSTGQYDWRGLAVNGIGIAFGGLGSLVAASRQVETTKELFRSFRSSPWALKDAVGSTKGIAARAVAFAKRIDPRPTVDNIVRVNSFNNLATNAWEWGAPGGGGGN